MNTTTVCVLAYDPETDKFLVVKDKEKHKKGFVTGGVEDGEEPEDAAVREFMEEVGIEISRPHPEDVVFQIEMPSRENPSNKHIFKMYKIEIKEQELQIGQEIESASFVSCKELEEMHAWRDLLKNHADGFLAFRRSLN